ncbi:fatty acid desaturase [Sphingomonas solaris]|uniref:Fatty acid desaturase n=1 Tax=Alterirhizorhabdus solaris TaxID=2529389 RepID=A0A558QVD7_9SPHN|nr:fatty acid desaturase [Sphingomonas solaris]TVV71085.1 fatty acid desaturase [Sphingomonas solaris]
MTARRIEWPSEWPTVAVAVAIHVGWLAATWWHAELPGWLLLLAGGWLVAWHGSLQHETIHGHPTASRRLNALIGSVPLSLWLPYATYRRTHIEHHDSPAITDPFDDPESRYLAHRPGLAGAVARGVARVEATLLGRLILGPPLGVARFLMGEVHRARVDPAAVAREWGPHLLAVAAVLVWLHVCRFDVLRYVLFFVWPGTALSLLRSFAEHRANDLPGHRVALVERAGPLALLYLNNNLHAAHHRAPGVPWFALPAYHRRHRAALLSDNGGLVYAGYGDVARRYLFRAHDAVLHPDHA